MRINAESYRLAAMALLLSLLVGANNLIKILRDSVFLGHHSVSELPYLYILVAFIAGVIIATYTKYTAQISIVRLMLWTNAVILSNIIVFWVLLTYFDSAWSHYAFYIWSAMATVIAVAQAWTLANHIFTEEEARRSFGLLAAGGTVGGIVASFGAQQSIHLSVENNQLLAVVAGVYIVASTLVIWVESRLKKANPQEEIAELQPTETSSTKGIGELLAGSPYLKTIAVIILLSVIVSTIIDFHFKIGAKEAYPSTRELAGFFSSYYGWLNVATLFVQLFLTGRVLSKLGLGPSLYVTPGALLTGSLAIIIWPGLTAPMLTRMVDTILRNSIHRSGMEVIYMAVPASVVKAIKTFLDVVVERLGDAGAGFIILLFSLFAAERYIAYLHFICIGMILGWAALNRFLQYKYAAALRGRAISPEPLRRRSWLESE